MTEAEYKEVVLKSVSEYKLRQWLKKNPPPKTWKAGKYAWAYTEMPVGLLNAKIYFRE